MACFYSATLAWNPTGVDIQDKGDSVFHGLEIGRRLVATKGRQVTNEISSSQFKE